MEVINTPAAIVGPIVAGEAAKTRKALEQLIKKLNASSFDLSDLLYKVKKNGYYDGYDTFTAYVRTLEIKPRKAQYLTRIAEVMGELSIPREKYEVLGTAKLREITSLNVNDTWVNPETKDELPITDFVVGFVEKGADMTLDEIKQHVKTLKGLVGTEALSWVHLYMKQSAIDNVVRPALELAKAQIGSVSKDDEGISHDASDGAAAEVVFVSFLNDPANGILAGA